MEGTSYAAAQRVLLGAVPGPRAKAEITPGQKSGCRNLYPITSAKALLFCQGFFMGLKAPLPKGQGSTP